MRLSLLSKYRTHIMGAAMMWIMFTHTIYFGQNEVIHFFHIIGIYGVDMFLLVSGLGIYRSMRQSKSVGEFYKKRAIRILPAYFIASISWYIFFKPEVSFSDKLMSIFGINYFRGTIQHIQEFFDWFIPFIVVMYLLTPLYDKIFQKVESKWKLTVLASMISPILAVIAAYTGRQVLFYSIVRIPIYLIGYCIGWFLYENKEEKKGSWMVFVPLLCIGLLAIYLLRENANTYNVRWGLNAYTALMIAPGISMLLAFIWKYMEKWLKIVGKILMFPFYLLGRYSLEVYLLHQRLLDVFNSDKLATFRNNAIPVLTKRGFYFMVALVTIAGAVILHELIALVIRQIKKAKKKKTDKPAPKSAAKAS